MGLPYTIANGQAIDATPVMANFNSLDGRLPGSGVVAAASGANSDITSLSALTTPLSVAQGGTGSAAFNGALGGTQFGWRNLLINPLGNNNGRQYASGTATVAANQYTLDRWRVVTTGQNLSWAASGIANVMTAPAGGVEQVVEGALIIGGTYTLSWTGTATATVNGTAVANGATVTLTAGTNATVRFIGGTFSFPQLERGSGAGIFEVRPFTVEYLLCQRYCPSFYAFSVPDDFAMATFSSTSAGTSIVMFKVPPRAAPTGVSYAGLTGPGNLGATTASAFASLNNVTFASAGWNSARISISQAGTTWATGQSGFLFFNTVGAGIYFTGAEL